MSLLQLQEYTYFSKYARWIIEKKRRENWKESTGRVKQMMFDQYRDILGIEEEINNAYDFVLKKRVLGSQRVLQFAGSPIFKHNCRAYNCCASYIDRLRFFQECMYLLLCGCGTGFSVQKCHINQLPHFTESRINKEVLPESIYSVEDSIEGWSDAVGILISSYFENAPFPDWSKKNVIFDFSKIRPAGSFLSSCSGKAPGPEPLKKSLEEIRKLLDNCAFQTKLKPINAYDIVMYLSDAVLSGGVRRSATICIFSFDDEEMYNAKIGDWYYKNPQRGRSNNSALLLRDKVTFEEFCHLIKSTKQWGEPGFIWASDEDELFNPCVEASLYAKTIYGESGWQFCNLSTLNGKKIKSEEDFLEAAEAAAIIGTLQAGFTNFPYLGKASEDITKREALLGVSITGIMENSEILLDPKIQKKVALHIKRVNERAAKKLNINPASRLTNLKPEGTTSCFLGTSSGIHPHHAKRYFRTVQANNTEPVFQYFKTINPIACEKSYWSNNNTDSVIRFCIEVEEGAKLKNDLPAIELLKAVKITQDNWVKYGTIKERLAIPTLKHNVSNTIQVKENEWDEVTKFIFDNRDSFAGVSLIPWAGDKDYVQAPFCTVFTPSQIIKEYGDASIFASGVIEECLKHFDNLWIAADCYLDLLKPTNEEQAKCLEKMQRFSEKYFDSDKKKMTYCLKDVFN